MSIESWEDVLTHKDEFVGRDLEFKDPYEAEICRGPIADILRDGNVIIFFLYPWTALKHPMRDVWEPNVARRHGFNQDLPLLHLDTGKVGYSLFEHMGWGTIYPPGENLSWDDVAKITLA